jgi:hypothetical protein
VLTSASDGEVMPPHTLALRAVAVNCLGAALDGCQPLAGKRPQTAHNVHYVNLNNLVRITLQQDESTSKSGAIVVDTGRPTS